MVTGHQRTVPWRVMLALGLLIAGGAPAAAPTPEPGGQVQRSASGRFSVYGPDPLWNLQWLLAAEESVSRLERFLGKPLPHERGFPLRLIVDNSPLEAPSLASRDALSGGVLDQRIFVRHPARLEPGVLEDRLMDRLLVRYVSYPDPAPDVRLPAWFVTGLSEFCRESDRADLCRTVREAWIGGKLPSLARVMSWEHSVPREESGRAVCMAWILWAAAQPEAQSLAERLLASFQKGEPGLASLRTAWPGIGATDRDAEIQWNLWVASLGGRMPGPLQSPVEAASALLGRLGVSREIAGAVKRSDLPERVTPATLLEYREEDWVPPAAVRMARSLSFLQVMELPPALRELRNGYIRWLDRLAAPDLREDRVEGRALALELDRLDSALRTYLEWTMDRKAFLDGIEAERASVRLREEEERGETLGSGIREFLDKLESTIFFSIGEEPSGR